MRTLLWPRLIMEFLVVKSAKIFVVPRVRRAFYASELVMFMQQFCGVNAIVSHS